jgi:DUF4097 and DUF4098 domain-containing protein YvlB
LHLIAGNLTIVGVPDATGVEVEAEIRAEADSTEAAQQLLQESQFVPEIKDNKCWLLVKDDNHWLSIDTANRSIRVNVTADLTLRVPRNMDLHVSTDRGFVDVTGMESDCDLATKDGPVRANTAGRRLEVTTRAGEIDAITAALDVQLRAEGDGVRAHLTGEGPPQTQIQTASGDIEVFVADDVSARLSCNTRGEISIDLPWEKEPSGKYVALGRIGAGEGRLDVTSKTGNIKISRQSP